MLVNSKRQGHSLIWDAMDAQRKGAETPQTSLHLLLSAPVPRTSSCVAAEDSHMSLGCLKGKEFFSSQLIFKSFT